MKFEKLSYLMDYEEELSESAGIYHWVYWPSFDPTNIALNQLEERLKEFSCKYLAYSESFKGAYKFQGEIRERLFSENGEMFGLVESKSQELLQYLQHRPNVLVFYEIFKEICFGRPFYIGKANNLSSRLRQHFGRRNSEILNSVDQNGIPYSDIWVGQRELSFSATPRINNIIEEICSRIYKPGLTVKPN